MVPPMTDDEGMELLLHRNPASEVNRHPKECGQIIRRLGGLPLAIDQASAFIRCRQFQSNQLKKFSRLYEEQRQQVLQYTLPQIWADIAQQVHGKEEENRAIAAFTTWEMSFRQLEGNEERRRDIEHFLTVSSFLQPDHIGEPLFRSHWEWTQPAAPTWMKIFTHETCIGGCMLEEASDFDLEDHEWSDIEDDEQSEPSQESWDQDLFGDLISKAHDLLLLDKVAGGSPVDGPSFSLHPMISDWLQVRAKAEPVQRYLDEALEVVANSLRQEDDSPALSSQTRTILLGHVDTWLQNAGRFIPNGQNFPPEPQICHDLVWLAWFYADCGRYRESGRLFRQVWSISRRVFGRDDEMTLTSMNFSGQMLLMQGRYAEAEKMHRKELQLKRRVLGNLHPGTLSTMQFIGIALNGREKYEEAEKIHRETLRLKQRVLGNEHPETLQSMTYLAVALNNQTQYAEAEKIHREALQLSEKVLGREHLASLVRMNALGETLHRQEKYEEEEKIHWESLQLSERTLGKEHRMTLAAIGSLGAALGGQGKYEEAEKMCRRGSELSKTILGEEHPATLASTSALATLLGRQGKHQESERMHREVLELRQRVLGKRHPSTLISLEALAILLAQQSQFVQATVLFERAAKGFKRALGPYHPDTVTCVQNYASMCDVWLGTAPTVTSSRRT